MSPYAASWRRELRVVLLLLGVEAEVLEEQQLPVPQPLHGVLGPDPEGVAGHRHVPVEERAEALGDRPQPQAVLDLAVRPAEVAGQDDPGALGEQGPDGRQGRPDALVVGHLAVGEWDVEVDAQEDALARGVDVADGELVHGSPWSGPGWRPVGRGAGLWARDGQARTPAGSRAAT